MNKKIKKAIAWVWYLGNIMIMFVAPILLWLSTTYGQVLPDHNGFLFTMLLSVIASYVCFKKWG